MTTIRFARPEDAGAIAQLSGQLGYPATPESIRDRLAGAGDPAGGASWVATGEDGAVCGFARAVPQRFVTEEAFAELAVLVVEESRRSRGVGAALLGAAEAWALGQGFPGLRLHSNVLRERAHRFYRRQGYAEMKRQVVFGKRLDPGDGNG